MECTEIFNKTFVWRAQKFRQDFSVECTDIFDKTFLIYRRTGGHNESSIPLTGGDGYKNVSLDTFLY